MKKLKLKKQQTRIDCGPACNKINFECDAFNASIEEIDAARKIGEIQFPIICHIVSEDNSLHFVVVKKIIGNKVTVYDPGPGVREVSVDDFTKLFTGNFMYIKPGKDFKEKKEIVGLLI